MRLKSIAWECLCLAVFLGLAASQLFFRPITGLSDNNDFPKVFGPAHICQAPHDDLNAYFVTGYRAGPDCAWPSGFLSTEILLLDLARQLGRPFTGRYYFDLRSSGALHLAILALAMALFLRVTRRRSPAVRFLLPAFAIFIFSDVAYVAYLNSAYMDNASWVLFLLLAALAAQAAGGSSGRWVAPAYALVGILLIFSKAQHAILGIPFAGLAIFYAWSHRDSIQRAIWSLAAVALLASAVIMPTLTPRDYRNISLFNLVFSRLALRHPAVLEQLRLTDYRPWIGRNAFNPGSPLPDPDWSRAFVSRVSYGDVALLYLRHPGIAIDEIAFELHDSAYTLRPRYMANYRQADGFPLHSMATRFSLWSHLRARTLWYHPHHLLVLYALPLIALIVCRLRRIPIRSGLLPLALTLSAAGILEFLVCTLADAIDTDRHLFLFQVITETNILLAAGWLLSVCRAPRGHPDAKYTIS